MFLRRGVRKYFPENEVFFFFFRFAADGMS